METALASFFGLLVIWMTVAGIALSIVKLIWMVLVVVWPYLLAAFVVWVVVMAVLEKKGKI